MSKEELISKLKKISYRVEEIGPTLRIYPKNDVDYMNFNLETFSCSMSDDYWIGLKDEGEIIDLLCKYQKQNRGE